MSLYHNIKLNMLKENENREISRVTIDEQTMDSISLFYKDGKYGVVRNLIPITIMGEDVTFTHEEEPQYFQTYEEASKRFESLAKKYKQQAALENSINQNKEE